MSLLATSWVNFAARLWDKEAVAKLETHGNDLNVHYPDAPPDGQQYARQDNAWVPIANALVGFYDQVADQIVNGGALDSGANYNIGDYYTLTTTGAFATALPNLAGETGVEGDRIISDGTVWIHVTAAAAYLSAVADDTAAGVITFTPAPKSSAAPAVDDELTRKDYVDAADAADRAYTDAEIVTHTGATDPHGDRAYSDAELAAHNADASTHLGHFLDSLIHFPDVPIDGTTYGRRNQQWVQVPGVEVAILGGTATISGALDTTLKPLQNWTYSAETLGWSPAPDPATGIITVPAGGVWQMNAMVNGDQGNDEKEIAMRMHLRIAGGGPNAGDYLLWSIQVSDDKNSDRSFAGLFTRPLDAGETLQLTLSATASTGSWSTTTATFELQRVL